MNEINIFGVSIPAILVIYWIIRIFQQAKDNKVAKEVEERIKKMTPEERDLYAKDLKGKMKELLNRPKTTFEKIVNATVIIVVATIGIGAIIGIIYFIYFEN